MSVPGVSSVGSIVSRTVDKLSSKIPQRMEKHLKNAKLGAATFIGLVVLICVAVYAGKHGDTEEGKKKIGKKVSNTVDLIVIYGVAILTGIVLLLQTGFAVSVLVMRKDFNTVSSQIENFGSVESSTEELLSALTLNI